MNVVPMQQQDLQIAFDDFWSMYPRRVAKKDARRAWEKIPQREHFAILTALFEWRRIWQDRNEIEYIPYPASWLNGERWEDEFPPHHRPYTDRAQVVKAEKVEQAEKKPMPAHIKEAIIRMRTQ